VVPDGRFEPAAAAEFRAAAALTAPAGYQLLRLRWRSDDGQIAMSGSGAARVAPDSLRLDMAVRLGVGRATLILTGAAVQAEPAELVAQLLPDRFALWAAFGVVRPPDSVAQVARLADGARVFWRIADELGRLTTFELRGDTLLRVVRAEAGRDVARLDLSRDAAGAVRTARVIDLVRGGRFELEVVGRQAAERFPDDVWRLRP
jgi:hypothetical protein